MATGSHGKRSHAATGSRPFRRMPASKARPTAARGTPGADDRRTCACLEACQGRPRPLRGAHLPRPGGNRIYIVVRADDDLAEAPEIQADIKLDPDRFNKALHYLAVKGMALGSEPQAPAPFARGGPYVAWPPPNQRLYSRPCSAQEPAAAPPSSPPSYRRGRRAPWRAMPRWPWSDHTASGCATTRRA